jgi:hypothetical protein
MGLLSDSYDLAHPVCCSPRASALSCGSRSPLLLSSGPLVGAGKLNFGGVLLVAVRGCLLADLVWVEARRLRGKRELRLLCALTPAPARSQRIELKSRTLDVLRSSIKRGSCGARLHGSVTGLRAAFDIMSRLFFVM